MDSPHLTTAEEQAARHLERQTIRAERLRVGSDMENMPACVRGMALLKRFAGASPAGFGMAMRGGLEDPLQLKHPLFAKNAKWNG